LLVFIDFLIEVLPDTPSARLITANAVLESLMNKPAVSESVTVSRNKKLEPDVEVSGGTQAKKAFVAPVPCFITVHGPAAPAVEDSHLKVLVNCAVALSVATFTVNVSVMPTLRFAFTGFVYVGTDAVIQRIAIIPEPPFPPAREELAPEPAPPPPLPVSAAPADPPFAENASAPFPPAPKVLTVENEGATIPLPPFPMEEAVPSVPSAAAPPPPPPDLVLPPLLPPVAAVEVPFCPVPFWPFNPVFSSA
jgi:hypothetical protein